MPVTYKVPEKPKKYPRPWRYTVSFIKRDESLIEAVRAIGTKERRSLRNLIIIALEQWLEGREER